MTPVAHGRVAARMQIVSLVTLLTHSAEELDHLHVSRTGGAKPRQRQSAGLACVSAYLVWVLLQVVMQGVCLNHCMGRCLLLLL